MGVLDTVKRWLGREAADLQDAKRDLETRLDAELSRRERQLNETPMEAMERLQREADANSGAFDAVRDRIAGRTAAAEGMSEILDSPTPDANPPAEPGADAAHDGDAGTGSGPRPEA